MKVSIRTVEKLVGFALPPIEELAELINMRLGVFEEITDLGEKYSGARIVRVVQCEKHPDADKLSVCLVDDGGVVADVERDENGLVQVVCGAPNVHADMWAVWLPPKSTVPASFDDAEPFVLDARKLRGMMSYGMLAAGDELAISNDHEGIIEITERDLLQGAELVPGASFAKTFGLDDTIIEIENKMFTHRPDCFGQIGVAREIAGICGQKFTSPDWYNAIQEFATGAGLPLEVYNDASEKSPRFMAVAMKNVTIAPSPLWLQCALVALGSKPINNVVDATNYVMLMTAQPTHAYDYDTLRGQKLGVRMARAGETIVLLNGKTYELDESDIVIADAEGAVGLAGIMGGADTEVSDATKNIVLECATFDMYAVRKSSMRHGLFTDALTRFNKGQSPLQNAPVMQYLMNMVGGEQASEVFDLMSSQVDDCILDDGIHRANEMGITAEFIGERLGVRLEDAEIKQLLENVEFKVDIDDRGLNVYGPFWRMDIEEPEDIVEEVGRLYGFDELPRQLPRRSTKAAPKAIMRELKRQLRDKFSRMGANEVLTYSFVHEKTLKHALQDPSQAFRLSNALSPDLQYYRLSVLPSLLDKVHMNIKAGHDEFTLFEIGKGHDKTLAHDEENLPPEVSYLDAVYASKKPRSGAAYYRVRRMIELLMDGFGVKLAFRPMSADDETMATAPFEMSRSAQVVALVGDQEIPLGYVGELKPQVVQNFKLPEYTAACSLLLEEVQNVVAISKRIYVPLSRFPSTSRDISVKTADSVAFSEIANAVQRAIDGVRQTIEVRDELVTIYQPENESTKTTTLRLTLTSHDKTLTDKDITPIMTAVEAAVVAAGYEIV